VGYAVWYSVLPALRVSTASTVQLSVPAIAALGGAVFLAEPLSLRFLIATAATLGGIALAVTHARR
jgi:drug/metabolite transporter (DMT)-like permease